MAKYIIDIPEKAMMYLNVWEYKDGKCVWADSYTASELRPYTASESYIDGLRKGQKEVWDFVRIITDMTECERKECFGGSTCDLDEYMTYQEAKAKYEEWKNQKELRIGDEVILPDKTRGIVMDREDDDCVVINKDSYTIIYHVSELRNTGRHYDCIVNLAEVLKRYRDAV